MAGIEKPAFIAVDEADEAAPRRVAGLAARFPGSRGRRRSRCSTRRRSTGSATRCGASPASSGSACGATAVDDEPLALHPPRDGRGRRGPGPPRPGRAGRGTGLGPVGEVRRAARGPRPRRRRRRRGRGDDPLGPHTSPLAGQQSREDVVEQAQRHSPQDVALDVDPVHEQRLREAPDEVNGSVARDAGSASTRTEGVRTPTTSASLEPPARCPAEIPAEERVHAPARRARVERAGALRAPRRRPGRARPPPPPRATLWRAGRASSGSGFPPGSPSCPPCSRRRPCAATISDPEHAVRIAEDRGEDGGVPQRRSRSGLEREQVVDRLAAPDQRPRRRRRAPPPGGGTPL